jgi:two-component system phosphate regulon sensor histidine kinase PhoR
MKKTIFLKTFVGYVAIAVVLAGLILAFSFTKLRSFYLESATENLRNTAVSLEAAVAPLIASGRLTDLDSMMKELGKKIHVRITVIAPGGQVLADSEADPRGMVNHRTRTEIAQVVEGSAMGKFLRKSDTLQEEMLYIAVPIKKGAGMSGVLRLSLFLRDMNETLSHVKTNILTITLIILILSLFAAFFFSRSLSQPVRELIHATRRVGSQDFDVRILLKNQDEFKELADSFNSMIAQMRTLFSQLTHQTEELNSLIASLQEGLLVLDRDDRILICNESFKRITGTIPAEGEFYWEGFREPQFDELIGEVRRTRTNSVKEIGFKERTFLSSATYLETENEIAVLFLDITEIKNLERLKTDFVLNVSHELRTPLTAIKGFIEALDEVVKDEEGKRYVTIVKRNTERLINIVSDLLTLSELEEKGLSIEFSDVDLKEIAENVFRIFDCRIREKNLYGRITIEGDPPVIQGDPFKIEQMLINLIDNAVKYSEKGGIDVILDNTRRGSVSLTVKDTGIGIGREHLHRIFERFYVVDKSRSKKAGGTGLGLSIVKHVILVHNGLIDVESVPGKGTTFTITLPNPSQPFPRSRRTLTQN